MTSEIRSPAVSQRRSAPSCADFSFRPFTKVPFELRSCAAAQGILQHRQEPPLSMAAVRRCICDTLTVIACSSYTNWRCQAAPSQRHACAEGALWGCRAHLKVRLLTACGGVRGKPDAAVHSAHAAVRHLHERFVEARHLPPARDDAKLTMLPSLQCPLPYPQG